MDLPVLTRIYIDIKNLFVDYDIYVETTKSLAFSPAFAKAMSIVINGIAHGGIPLAEERELYEELQSGFSSISFTIVFPSIYSMNNHLQSVADGNIL